MALTAFRAKGDYALKVGGLYVLDTNSGEITGMGGAPVEAPLQPSLPVSLPSSAPVAATPPEPVIAEPPAPPPPPPVPEPPKKQYRKQDAVERERNDALLVVAANPDCLSRLLVEKVQSIEDSDHASSAAAGCLKWLKDQGYVTSREVKVPKGRGSPHGYLLKWTATKKGKAAAELIERGRKESGGPFVKALAS